MNFSGGAHLADQRTPDVNSEPSSDVSSDALSSPRDAVLDGQLETLRRARVELGDGASDGDHTSGGEPASTSPRIPGENDTILQARQETMRKAQQELAIDLREPTLPQREPTRTTSAMAGVPLNVNRDTRSHSLPTDPVAVSHLKSTYTSNTVSSTAPRRSPVPALVAVAALALAGVGAVWWFTQSDSDSMTPLSQTETGVAELQAGDDGSSQALDPALSQEAGGEEGQAEVQAPEPGANQANEPQPPDTAAAAETNRIDGAITQALTNDRESLRLVIHDGNVIVSGAPSPAAYAELRRISEAVLGTDQPVDRTSNRTTRAADDADAITGIEALETAEMPVIIALTDPLSDEASQDNPSTRVLAQRLARYLADTPEVEFLVTGHTDSTGPATENRAASLRQAQRFNQLLANAGADAARLTTRGAGELEPIADNGLPVGRELNSRVEVTLLFP